MSFVQSLLFDSSIPIKARQEALDRAFSDPGIPPIQSTSSFWLKDPHVNLAKTQSTDLPTPTDIVIIGSGITGASIARTLLTTGHGRDSPKPRILILEARDVCSGATGRNGGHILETVEEFTELEQSIGLEAAKKVVQFRLSHLDEVLAVAEEYGLVEEAQARKVQFLSVYFDDERWDEAVRCIKRFKECMPTESADWRIFEREIPTEFCLPAARGIIAGPAGALWPYRFVTGILDRLRDRFPDNLQIETNTPVLEINNTGADQHSYSVTTARGSIKARHLIHCTNAHVGHLVPGLRGRIYPIRGQISAQNPGQRFPSQGTKHSWLFNYDRGFDYLTQLPSGSEHDTTNKMMFGGGFAQGKNGGIDDLGISTDSEMSFYTDIHLSGALSVTFGRENWGTVSGPAVEMMWTGNMGFSADGFPWVGRLPRSLTRRGTDANRTEKGHEWVSAGFSGEGMVHAWLCGKALGRMILADDEGLSEQEDLSWFPEQMLVTEERAQASVLPRKVVERASHL
ncbi:NAD(P)/FAD-dependent oxidoreductase [Aspergillus affinis]|uniref:NAD(P)/FAD-dependent oxidoreductase n=1 Tax=Aspergillus affinis TaxID=1070780 RepID=UPI0022FE14FA|nr:putative FAD dependent oxidoreductase [Aspergillus affinis]KAI9040535.1 putative FAD dependent oxidoreductase [Aspergillus affinis]